MKERPILFSGEMVRAILAGRKTMTRRIVTPQPPANCVPIGSGYVGAARYWTTFENPANDAAALITANCPYGKPGERREASRGETDRCRARAFEVGDSERALQPAPCSANAWNEPVSNRANRKQGDRLWVKETFYAWGRWETQFNPKKRRNKWHFIDLTRESGKQYQYTEPEGFQKQKRGGVPPTWWKRPAIFMPRWASRLTLEISAVRVERLQDISEADALAEGIKLLPGGGFGLNEPFSEFNSARSAFAFLWDSINGKRVPWLSNPYVWVIEFKRMEVSQ